MSFSKADKFFMHQAIELAKKARGFTSPNPMVGAILVKDGRILAKGYHAKAGYPHAEAIALKKAGFKAEGATLYVNLEPCSHFGRTPPCTQQIIAAKVKRVVVAIQDPNPLVDGKGLAELKDSGIEVEIGLLESRARNLNEVFITNCKARRPFVALKIASSLDGKIALLEEKDKWLTGQKARAYSRYLRGFYDAVMVGINTVLKDDPQLTPRHERFQSKKIYRIVCDAAARTPLNSKLIKGLPEQPVIIAASPKARATNLKKLSKAGAVVLLVEEKKGKLDLNDLFEKLYSLGICSVFVEGGATLLSSFFRQSLFDKFYLFYAPYLLGGDESFSLLRGCFPNLAQAPTFKLKSLRFFGKDIMLELYPETSIFTEN